MGGEADLNGETLPYRNQSK